MINFVKMSISIEFFLIGHFLTNFDLIFTYLDNLNYNFITYVNNLYYSQILLIE